MKIIKILIVCLGFTSSFCLPNHFNDVVIILSDESSEPGTGPIYKTFLIALCQTSYPIIITRQIAHTLVSALNGSLGSYEKRIAENESPKLDYYTIYKSKNDEFFLLIPPLLITNKKTEFPGIKATKDYHIDEILTGFAINHAEILTEISTDDFLKKSFEPLTNINIANLTSMFVNGTDEPFGMWNIILDGHGLYPELSFKKPLPKINTKDIDSAFIAGLFLPQFRELLQFFIQKIVVNILYYSSCYAGDANLSLAYMSSIINDKGNIIGNMKKPNFTIAIGSLTATPVSLSRKMIDCGEEGGSGYLDFFKAIHTYSNQKSMRPTVFNDQQLIKILIPVTPRHKTTRDPYGISALPSVIFPGVDLPPRVLPLDDTIAVITPSLIHRYVLDKKQINLVNKEVILLYADTIEAPITITTPVDKPAPAIISMIPHAALHHITRLETNLTFEQFVSTFKHVESAPPKYFVFDALTLRDASLTIQKTDTPEKKSIPISGTLTNVIVLQFENKVFMLFTESKEKRIYFYNNEHIQETTTSFVSTIKDNKLADIIHNYFNTQHTYDINFMDDVLKSLLSPEIQKLIRPTLNDQLLTAVKKNDNKSAEKYLAAGADSNARNKFGQTPLIIASQTGNTAMITLLLSHKADVNARDKIFQESALMHATFHKNVAAIELLLKAKADISLKSEEGKTALDIAQEEIKKPDTNSSDRDALKAIIKLLEDHIG